jgi:hypothetical protein
MNHCENCSKEYEVKKHTSKTQRFCSTYCRVDFHQKKRSQEINETRKNICSICGSSYFPDRLNSTFCSNACKQSAYRKRKKESNPFTLEFYRLSPELCLDESGKTGFFNSSLYKNGIGLDRLIEEWKESPEMSNNVNIKSYLNGENASKQSSYQEYYIQKCMKEKWYIDHGYKAEDFNLKYPFFVLLENDKIAYFNNHLDPHDGLTRNLAFAIICERIESRDKAKKYGLLGVEYSEALDQFARWKEEIKKAEKKKASIEKAKATREANRLKKQMI